MSSLFGVARAFARAPVRSASSQSPEILLFSAAMPHSVSRDRILGLLERAKDRRIAVVGDAMLDVYLRGDVERISPEAPVPVVRVRDKELALGGAANVAQNIFAIGAQADLVCAVGDDAEGQVIKAMLRDIGSESRSVVTVGRRTTTKTRVLARS